MSKKNEPTELVTNILMGIAAEFAGDYATKKISGGEVTRMTFYIQTKDKELIEHLRNEISQLINLRTGKAVYYKGKK